MIAFLISLLLTLQSGGDPCQLGTPVDWYAWGAAHEDAHMVFSINAIGNTPDIWLFEDNGGSVLFVFNASVQDALDSGQSVVHGECAVLVDIGN